MAFSHVDNLISIQYFLFTRLLTFYGAKILLRWYLPMVRKARKKSRNGIYHIIMRGVNQQTIFEEDNDRQRFLDTLTRYKEISKYKIYSYCLMDNHIHLLWGESEEESVSESMKRICSSYVHWYNAKYERTGHLFQERFKNENVEDKRYFLTVLRYIHQNPVKAKIESNVFKCKWTSAQEYIFGRDLVDIEFGLQLFSSIKEEAIELYINYMQQKNNDKCLEITTRIKKSDQEIKKYLAKLGFPRASLIQQMKKEKRDEILASLRELEGVSIRQLARVTGISKSVIGRAGRDGGTGTASRSR